MANSGSRATSDASARSSRKGRRLGRAPLVPLLAVAVVALAACGSGSSASGGSAASGSGSGGSGGSIGCEGRHLKVALVLPGPADDHGYNAAAVAGLEAAKKTYCLDTSVTDTVSQSNSFKVVSGYAASGYDVIIGHNEQFQDAMVQAAQRYPKVDYFAHAGDIDGNPHVQSSFLAEQDPAYLMGVLAGHLTKTDKIGFVGYQPLGIVISSMNAFLEGARSVKPDTKLFHIFTTNLTDSSVATQATNTLLGNGADVIAHINGGTNSADILKTAESHHAFAMGFPVDQSAVAPDAVASSLLVNYPQLVQDEIKEVVDGSFKGGLKSFSLSSGIVGLAPPSKIVPQDAVDAVNKAKQDLESGAIKVDVSSKDVEQ